MSDELNLVTDTIEYKGKRISFSLHRFAEKPELLLWYIEAMVEGFEKPFQSKLLSSIFARDVYEKAKHLEDAQDYVDYLFKDINIIKDTTCELLTATLDSISIMWYCNGKVQIEEDGSLVTLIKEMLDKYDEPYTQAALLQSGFLSGVEKKVDGG